MNRTAHPAPALKLRWPHTRGGAEYVFLGILLLAIYIAVTDRDLQHISASSVDPAIVDKDIEFDEDQDNNLVFYHYTDEFLIGTRIYAGNALTNEDGLEAAEASDGLGIPPPNKLYSVKIPLSEYSTYLDYGGEVERSNRYSGGLQQWFLKTLSPPVNGPQTVTGYDEALQYYESRR